MNITELSVKRPTAIIVVVILFIAAGIIGYMNLGADLLPSAKTPIISILTTYPGAGSKEIEKDIVKPIEDVVSGINGLDRMRSFAGDGYGYTILQFRMSTDTNTAVVDVQKALESISNTLPEDASRPVMRKYDINMQPILILSISGAIFYKELYNEAERIKYALEKLPGVGNVSLGGVLKKQLTISMDKTAIEYYGASLNNVLAVLRADNLNIPAGQIRQDTGNQIVRVDGEFQDIDEIENLRIPLSNGGMVRLAEFAKVELRYPEESTKVRLDGKTSIGIFIQKQSDTNIVETVNLVKRELNGLKKTLLPGVNLVIASDSTTFINSSLGETRRNLVESVIVTAIVLFLFLRRVRSSLIILVAIPTSLVSTFFFMYLFKFTFNIISLMGLALCIGILVDDSIVVLENIHRHIQLGKDPKKAAVEGRMEIGMAAVAITMCDVVVFTPVAFMGDMVGQFFKEFGLTVVFATLFSLFVSFTLTPMMSSRLYRRGESRSGIIPFNEAGGRQGRFSAFFDTVIKNRYSKFLIWSLRNRWKIVFAVIIGVVLSILPIPLKYISTEFIPGFDQGKLLIDIGLTPGASLKMTDSKTRIVEKYLSGLPEVKDYLTTVGSNDQNSSASIIVKLVDKNGRSKSQSRIAKEMRAWGKELPGVSFSVTETGILDRTSIDSTKPVVINITGPDTDVLKKISNQVEKIVRSVPGAVDIDNSTGESQKQLSVKIDRLAASGYGITTYDAAVVLRTALEGTKSGIYRKNGNDYDIVVKFMDSQLKTPEDIGSIKIAGSTGIQVALNQIADIFWSDSPKEILRLNRQNVITISSNVEGRMLGSINGDISRKLEVLQLPYGYEIKLGGEQQNIDTSFDSLIKALIVSVFLVYMILVVLYNSFLTPFIRMLSLPCGIIGALAALVITGKSLNIVSLIGLIMLDGLASKNGTLLIDYTNTLMKKGLCLKDALIEAGTTRLRPILMTSVTMIVGMLPTALSLGDGSEIKSGMAAVLIGGLVTSTILSPILLPVVYTLIDDFKTKITGKSGHDTVNVGF